VPNVVNSCYALVHAVTLVLSYGISDGGWYAPWCYPNTPRGSEALRNKVFGPCANDVYQTS
jgi:hypothetical protein